MSGQSEGVRNRGKPKDAVNQAQSPERLRPRASPVLLQAECLYVPSNSHVDMYEGGALMTWISALSLETPESCLTLVPHEDRARGRWL